MKLAKILVATGVVLSAALGADAAFAAAAGAVTQLSGTLAVQRADGSIKLLSQKSEVGAGDTLTTQKDSYAQIKVCDGGLVTLKPNTRVKFDDCSFDERKPDDDNMAYSLLKGGLRFVSGLIGKRGNKDAYKLQTATATIGIRGTAGGADDCLDPLNPCVNPESKITLPPGVYVNVTEGEIIVTNSQGAGSLNLTAGQFGLIGLNQSPISIPPNVAVPPFLAPPGFGGSSGNQECVVR
jgi:FecR protein